MNKILSKTYFSERVARLEVEAPLVARARRPGNFVIVRVGEGGERVPLTIAGADERRGSITLVVQAVGVSTRKLCALEAGDHITDVVGPLGRATHVERVGTVLACGGGVGIAPLLPIATAFKEAGNRVVSVIAGRGREQVILEEEIRRCSDEVVVMTDDGSLGRAGLVTDGMSLVIDRERVDMAVVVGPAVMMKFAAALTRRHGIRTLASLNALMVDGTGMCGACRVTVGGRTRFTCVDGPEFDAHEVDFDELLSRLGAFRDEETSGIK
ncbi:MAG: sulfide/dihydroorotate dehydrogenase-like FAD/NAD-binding protein [Odoribacteraceae bacterium]|jgi:NAD(P)H-flavin reductase|nr:sulfide/dihydroorotate dehydrogenase-like FAD/NAD-binding protein [Odoribacteraceae bacterium]